MCEMYDDQGLIDYKMYSLFLADTYKRLALAHKCTGKHVRSIKMTGEKYGIFFKKYTRKVMGYRKSLTSHM
jgi:hypothetical protein